MSVELGLPFAVDPSGRVSVSAGDERIQAKILQVLFTTPGERVNLPDFGCGLLDLVFEPNDPVLAAATEFSVGQALTRWLGAQIVVQGVEVQASGESVAVEVAWIARADGSRNAIRAEFR
jgi:phage baseplate assembly protein W